MMILITTQFFIWLHVLVSIPVIGPTQSTSHQDTPKIIEVSVPEAKEWIARNDTSLVILDVRTPKETAEGMIPGAIEMDCKAADFEQNIDQLDLSKTYLVYCRSGKRARKAGKRMIDKGFLKIYHLDGGYKQWLESNK